MRVQLGASAGSLGWGESGVTSSVRHTRKRHRGENLLELAVLGSEKSSRWAVSFAARSSDSARLRSRADLIWSTDRF
jgi:hypothetical protein